jgi:hypothetical protein
MRGLFGLVSLVIVLGLAAYLSLQAVRPSASTAQTPPSARVQAAKQAEQQVKESLDAAMRQSAERASQAAQ